ncbi:MAG: hypothetical protein IPI61_10110 [Syntrophaceae bacterium]|nr:hypothetical protein [Syntrophaceae bacterium]
MNGLQVLREVKKINPELDVMVMTASRHDRDGGRGHESRRCRLRDKKPIDPTNPAARQPLLGAAHPLGKTR